MDLLSTAKTHLNPETLAGLAEHLGVDASVLPQLVEESTDDFLIIEFPTNLSSVGITYTLETSSDLAIWNPATSMIHLSTSNNGDGTATRTYRSQLPADQLNPHSYFRIGASTSL